MAVGLVLKISRCQNPFAKNKISHNLTERKSAHEKMSYLFETVVPSSRES